MDEDIEPRFGFVVLHYLVDEATVQCVESIRTHCNGHDYRIVIVDNDSANGSYERLQEYFNGDIDVVLVHNDTNEGFARGNNVGYRLCRDKLACTYIVTINNDAMLADDMFITTCIDDFITTGCGVIGPDIVSLQDGRHQNPIYDIIDTHSEIERQQRHFSLLLKLEKAHLYEPIMTVKSMLTSAAKHSSVSYKHDTADLDISRPYKLHGACLIFTPAYIECFKDAFDPGTFLYFEEDILLLRCRHAGLTMLYDSRFRVNHVEDVSTNSMKQHRRDKQIFVWTNYLQSLQVLNSYVK